MPAARTPVDPHARDRRPEFLLGQSIWRAVGPVHQRWSSAIREDEPSDDASRGEHAFRPPLDEAAGEAPNGTSAEGRSTPSWLRLRDRAEVIRYATEDDQWQRTGLVCGAGLGKTTNLKWLAARINAIDDGRGRQLAIFAQVDELPASQDDVLHWVTDRVADTVGQSAALRFAVERLLLEGRVTWLLDSLDQTDPAPEGDVMQALGRLVQGRWKRCRVWVSGRPYAFRIARTALEPIDPEHPWQFLRIGQLDEPECRQLLERTRPPGA